MKHIVNWASSLASFLCAFPALLLSLGQLKKDPGVFSLCLGGFSHEHFFISVYFNNLRVLEESL